MFEHPFSSNQFHQENKINGFRLFLKETNLGGGQGGAHYAHGLGKSNPAGM